MSNPPVLRQDGVAASNAANEISPEVQALNFFEVTPVNKIIYTLTPTPWDVKLSKISFNFGCTDLSANGYVQLVLSKAKNPDIYATVDSTSSIVFTKMGGANVITTGDSDFFTNCVLCKNEPLYVFLISNVPAGVGLGIYGRVALYYLPLYR